METDPYGVLGLTRTATAAGIKKAYRRLARQHHPDLSPDDPGAEARFKAVTAAHDLLKDPATRARFDAGEIDASGAERPPRQYFRDFADAPGNPYHPRQGFAADSDPAGIFADILRGHRGRRGEDQGFSASGPDLRYALEVGFLDAARGAELHLTLGPGNALSVRIPPGARDGQTLRLRGKGGQGFGGGPAGDALIILSLRPHPVFRRDGDDILVTLPVTIDEAVLGGKVTAPTITGPVSLTIPPGTSSGRVLRLRGRGVARADGGAMGDQRVEISIMAPQEPDEALRDFLTGWRTANRHDPRRDLMDRAAP